MSVATRARADWQLGRSFARARVSTDAAAVVGLAAWCVVLVALTWRTWGDLGSDTGYDLLAAARTAQGELPYADYVYYYGPVAPLLLGGLYAAFGASVQVAVAFGLALSALIVGLAYRLARVLAGPWAGALAAALTATAAFGTANNAYVLPHSFSAPIGMALALVTVLALLSFTRTGDRRRLAGAGLAGGLAALTRPELAAALLVTLIAWSAMRAVSRPAGRGPARRDCLALLGPALGLPLAVYGAFAAWVGPRTLALENLYPVEPLRQAGRVVLRGLAPLTAESFITLGGRLVMYGVGVLCLLAVAEVIARRGRGRHIAIAIVVATAAAVGVLGVVLARPETARYYLQFAYGWIPAGAWVAVAVLGWRLRRRGMRWTEEEQAPLIVALLLAVIATTAYGAFYPHPRPAGPQATAYAMPLVAVFMVWLHLRVVPRGRAPAAVLGAGWIAALAVAGAGLVAGDAREETVVVRGAHGALAAPAAQGPALQAAVDAIERRTRAGEPILLAPQLTSLYVMTNRTNPLDQLSLLPGALAAPADEDRAIRRMAGVRLAVTDRRRLALYGHRAFGETFDRRLAAWLRRDFERAATLRGAGPEPRTLDLWIRRTTP